MADDTRRRSSPEDEQADQAPAHAAGAEKPQSPAEPSNEPDEPDDGASQTEGAQPAGTESSPDTEANKVPPADVYDVLRFSVGLLLSQAWIHLGLRTAPGSTETVTDLPRARVAIDCAAALYDKLKPVLTDDERRQIELELTNLRLNFAKRA